MCFQYIAGIAQAKAMAFYIMFVALRDPEEFFENTMVIYCRNTVPIIPDTDLQGFFQRFNSNFQCRTTILYGIVDQVVKRTAQMHFIGSNHQAFVRQVERKLYAFLLYDRLQRCNNLLISKTRSTGSLSSCSAPCSVCIVFNTRLTNNSSRSISALAICKYCLDRLGSSNAL